MKRRGISLVCLTFLLSAVACSGGDKATTVSVRLQEFSIVPAQSSVAAGEITFDTTNAGPADPHELVVIKTDLDPGKLPTKADGAVDENGAGMEVIGEIEEFPVGERKSATYKLSDGKYALVCNIVEIEDGQTEAHYKMGMWVSFTVT